MQKNYLIIYCLVFLYSTSCNKVSTSPTNQLPPLTTEGLNTFGCLVNGKIFVPQKPSGDLGPYYGCQYQYIYPASNTPYIFGVYGKDKPNPGEFTNVLIDLDSVTVHQGDTFQLGLPSRHGKQSATYSSDPANNAGIIDYNTTDSLTGQITITFFDKANQIASGTFWFNATDGTGDTVHITEGRFDMHFIE
jgi:hypothetical protein